MNDHQRIQNLLREGRINGGDLDARGPFTLRGRDFKGLLGRGEARLGVEHNHGDLTLEA
ncbi:hypothetical protein [Calidithermus roseus]|uniref:Uncharacterized protein n=1 Tax=Calidithermus roseus TaxID=1644118 RepID=A0A399EAH7_9DEIN|nr:hypothetical protein [Calidithermus roseus]RIH81335.1 hypothetical protein Mrose_03593 [Calidithermus roseus]